MSSGPSESTSAVVRTETRGSTALIWITRPERLNALTHEVVTDLRRALREVGERRDVRAVVLAGEGRAFCAGMDLGHQREAASSNTVEAMNATMQLGTDLIWTIRRIPQPVLCVVQGHAVGAGFAFAAAADLRFVGPKAQFTAPFLQLGMTVGDLGLSWFLPRLVGSGRAAEIFYSGRRVDAEEAVRIGLTDTVHPDPLAAALDRAVEIAQYSSYAVTTSKQLMDASASSTLRDHLDAEARAQVIGSVTDAAQLALSTALSRSKRRPRR